ncbi:SIS domain-containing protein [Sphingobium sp. CFD-2]|uniref:SIS domain-containing protein n=1 Tax=Sphingobium sp. CFD-2 TaxID=2878542 RepID=UPI00214A905E|nr:SIS domain-containing protein [Sphingobium sp. CFD-2]
MTYFPDRTFPEAAPYASEYFARLNAASATINPDSLNAAANLILDTTKTGKRIYSCGNGGSAAIANHLVCDCLKGIRSDTALRPKVHSFSTTVELITAIVNDIGSEEMFSFQLSSMAEAGDLLIAISSSGSSPNIIRVLELARTIGVRTIAMTGFTGGKSAQIADVSLHVECENYGIVEDIHQSLMHILAQYCRHREIDDPAKLGQVKF